MTLPAQALLKAAILAWEVDEALAVVFLVDRFLYWSDESKRLLSLIKLLHRRDPGAPVAPQLVTRQSRLHLNSGGLGLDALAWGGRSGGWRAFFFWFEWSNVFYFILPKCHG